MDRTWCVTSTYLALHKCNSFKAPSDFTLRCLLSELTAIVESHFERDSFLLCWLSLSYFYLLSCPKLFTYWCLWFQYWKIPWPFKFFYDRCFYLCLCLPVSFVCFRRCLLLYCMLIIYSLLFILIPINIRLLWFLSYLRLHLTYRLGCLRAPSTPFWTFLLYWQLIFHTPLFDIFSIILFDLVRMLSLRENKLRRLNLVLHLLVSSHL